MVLTILNAKNSKHSRSQQCHSKMKSSDQFFVDCSNLKKFNRVVTTTRENLKNLFREVISTFCGLCYTCNIVFYILFIFVLLSFNSETSYAVDFLHRRKPCKTDVVPHVFIATSRSLYYSKTIKYSF